MLQKQIFLYIVLLIGGCSETIIEDNEIGTFHDSSISSITVNPDKSYSKVINRTYSSQYINFGPKSGSYITRTTQIDERQSSSSQKTITIEFLDDSLKKCFEITVKNQNHELWGTFYITTGLRDIFPGSFELNNYHTMEPFVRCDGICWRTLVPGSNNTEAFIGYQQAKIQNDPNKKLLGTLHYSIGQDPAQEVKIYDDTMDSLKIFPSANISIIPKKAEDEYINEYARYFKQITLESQRDNTSRQAITGFDIVLKFRYQLGSYTQNNDTKDIRISVIDGKLEGAGNDSIIFYLDFP